MNNRPYCICGIKLKESKPFSDNFLSLKCIKCKSTKFIPKGDCQIKFNYSESEKYNKKNALKSNIMRWAHKKLLKIIPNLNTNVLEIGCYTGAFVKILSDKNIDAFGIDINKNAIEFGRFNFKLQDRLFSLEDNFIKKINSILMIDLLEHIEEPDIFIKDIIKKNNNPLNIIISGPISPVIFHNKSDFPPHHLWRFSEKGLVQMMKINKYKLVRKEYEKSPFLLLRNLAGRVKYGMNKKEYQTDDFPFTGSSNFFKLLNRLSSLQINLPFIPRYNSSILIFKYEIY